MALKIPEHRVRDIIVTSTRSRSFSNEECFEQAMELMKFAIEVISKKMKGDNDE